MALFDDIIEDDTFNIFFEQEDWSGVLDSFHLASGLQLEPDSLNELWPSPIFTNDVSNDVPTTNGDDALDLQPILPDMQINDMAILENPPLDGNQNADENSNAPTILTPQQAVGNEGGIMYCMIPFLFGLLSGTMSVKQQPKANNRVRYACDGSRFLPDSRYHPMSLNLPDLNIFTLAPNQTLGVVMTIATITDDMHPQMFIHANDIEYRVPGAEKIGYGCVFVPFDQNDIKNRDKKFSRVSILYKKCDQYTFDLIPFDPLNMFGTSSKYTSPNKKNTGVAAKGKDFKRDYNLLSYKIIFQLAVKEDHVVYISNIGCETEDVHEKVATTTTAVKPTKRTASFSAESVSEDDNISDTQLSNSSKRFKESTGLPVTRVSTRDNDEQVINDDER